MLFPARLLRLPLAFVAGLIVATQGPGPIRAQTGNFGNLSGADGVPVNLPRRHVIYFPPSPPVLGAPPPNPLFVDVRYTAPAELAPFVGEVFYPPLSTLIAEQRVGKKIQAQLDDFLQQRQLVERELVVRVQAIEALDPAAREAALEKLRADQQPVLTALEKAAEQLRVDCISRGTHWADLRGTFDVIPVDLHPARQKKSLEKLTLAFAYYGDDLLPVQRELLAEIALEANAGYDSPEQGLVVTGSHRLVPFLPASTSLSLPSPLPAALEEKLAGWLKLKAALKQELQTAVNRLDEEASVWPRKIAKKLVSDQATRLGQLESQAEEIRREMASHNRLITPAALLNLPPALTPQFDALRQQWHQIRAELGQLVRDTAQPYLRFDPNGFEINLRTYSSRLRTISRLSNVEPTDAPLGSLAVVETLRTNTRDDQLGNRLKATISTFSKDQATRFSDFDRARQAMEKSLAATLPADAALPAEKLLPLLLQIADQVDAWPQYANYRRAVLVPGLSPAQRRRLLGVAQRELARPLPGGEMQPYL